MSKKVVLLDDMEEGEIPADAGTIRFGLDGTWHEIDLSERNAAKLRSALGPYLAASRVAGRNGVTKKHTAAGGSGMSPDQLNAIRDWANRNGYKVSSKGRIPGEVLIAFEQAQGVPKAPKRVNNRKAAAPDEPPFSG